MRRVAILTPVPRASSSVSQGNVRARINSLALSLVVLVCRVRRLERVEFKNLKID